jgi:hypothetical protein
MRKSAIFVFVVFARFWPDSARTRHPTAKIAASHKVNRAAFDIFILLVFFYAPALWIPLCGNAADALRLTAQDIEQAPATKASRILKRQRQKASTPATKK